MSLKKILRAAFEMRNLALLGAIVVISFATGYIPFTLVGVAGYAYFVLQTLRDEKFQKEYAVAEKLDGIEALNEECRRLYTGVRGKIGMAGGEKVRGVMQERKEIFDFFRMSTDDPLKQKIVEQVLNLVIAYIKLIYNYSLRNRELTSVNVNKIMDRINNNTRKLGFLKSHEAVLELEKAIELDEKLVQRVNEERNELEKISARLDYIESTIRMFKHQIISSQSSDETLNEIENAVNEATALDNVLNTGNRDRLRI